MAERRVTVPLRRRNNPVMSSRRAGLFKQEVDEMIGIRWVDQPGAWNGNLCPQHTHTRAKTHKGGGEHRKIGITARAVTFKWFLSMYIFPVLCWFWTITKEMGVATNLPTNLPFQRNGDDPLTNVDVTCYWGSKLSCFFEWFLKTERDFRKSLHHRGTTQKKSLEWGN